MRRFATIASTAVLVVVASAVPVLAYPNPAPGGTGGHKTALTGANIQLGVVLLGALVLIGVSALVVGMVSKRRAAVHS
jgi:hypothetical protein